MAKTWPNNASGFWHADIGWNSIFLLKEMSEIHSHPFQAGFLFFLVVKKNIDLFRIHGISLLGIEKFF
jgi:hypothetical protein